MKILIADDSMVQIRQLTKILKELGQEVVAHAQDGTTAVRLYDKLRPDLVFLDVVMPEMDGVGALRLIRELDAQARVVMLTSTAGVGGGVDEALRLGALDVMPKPASLERIQALLVKMGAGGGPG